MQLGGLLTELRENILHDRSDRVSGSPDYLWSDETLVRYIDEAQKRFARKGLVLRDGTTPDVCQITLKTGVEFYPLHPSVLALISCRLTGDHADLVRAGHGVLDTYQRQDPYFFDSSNLSTLTPGKPLGFTTDEYVSNDDYDSLGVLTLRVFPAPSSEYNNQVLKLRVVRMPLETLRADCLTVTPEIPEVHHIEMLDWSAYLALRIIDVDGGWAKRAYEFRDSFEAHVKSARDTAMRKLFTPLQWGFGRNGFSWEA